MFNRISLRKSFVALFLPMLKKEKDGASRLAESFEPLDQRNTKRAKQ